MHHIKVQPLGSQETKIYQTVKKPKYKDLEAIQLILFDSNFFQEPKLIYDKDNIKRCELGTQSQN